MKKILYANGDSFVFGMEAIAPRDKTDENKKYAFAKSISDMLGCSHYINNAFNGATNEFIFRRTLIDLLQMEKDGHDLSEVFAVIGITSLHRIEIDGDRFFEGIPANDLKELQNSTEFPKEHSFQKTLFANPGSIFAFGLINDPWKRSYSDVVIPWATQFLWTENVQMESQEARILALHEFLKSRKIDHVFVNTVCPLLRTRTNLIDFKDKHFFDLEISSVTDWCKANFPEEKQEWNHFTIKAHDGYAQHLFEHINSRFYNR